MGHMEDVRAAILFAVPLGSGPAATALHEQLPRLEQELHNFVQAFYLHAEAKAKWW